MRLEGRRSSRILPDCLSKGVVVSAPANGNCFFHLVVVGMKEIMQKVSKDNMTESKADIAKNCNPPSPKKLKANSKIEVSNEASYSSDQIAGNPVTYKWTDYLSISSLRNLVSNEYSEEVFQLMVVAGQVPCTTRTIPTFEQYRLKLIDDRAFADEHCIGIISSAFSLGFLILDDNIGGKPTIYWNASNCSSKSNNTEKVISREPKYFMTLRLGRQHYSGLRFDGRLFHEPKHLHPQIAAFWAKELNRIQHLP